MKKLYRYSIINMKPRTIDYEILPYCISKDKIKRTDLIMRSVKFRDLCYKHELAEVKYNIFKNGLFMYLNSTEQLSKEDVYKKFYEKYLELGKLKLNLEKCEVKLWKNY